MNIRSVCVAFTALLLSVGCKPEPTSSDKQRESQEAVLAEGVAQVGMPAIKNFRELKLVNQIYELRDQDGIITYTYLWNEFSGRAVFFCDSIGYGIPYATQYSAPESMQSYYIKRKAGDGGDNYGATRLPQAEPNGLFIPDSAEGTWIMCKNPNGKEVRPTYVEPRTIVSPFKLPDAIVVGPNHAAAEAEEKPSE